MTVSPEIVPLMVLLILPAVGAILAVGVPSLEFGRRFVAGCCGLTAGLAVWLALQTASTPVVWDAGPWLSIPGRIAWEARWLWIAEPVRLWWVAAVMGVAGLSLPQTCSSSRARLVAMAAAHSGCAAQWLAGELWLMLLCHGVVGVAAFVALSSDSGRPTAGASARKWLVSGLIGDAFLLAALVLLAPVVESVARWNTAATLTLVSELIPPLPGVVGAALVLGALVRAAVWPFNDWLHEATEGPSPDATPVVATAIWPSGLCWLVTAGPWLTQTPAAQLLAAGLGLLTAATSPFFAFSQSSPRRIIGWLLAGQSGLIVAALALQPEFASVSGLAGLGVVSAAVLCWQHCERLEGETTERVRVARDSSAGERVRTGWLFVVALSPAAILTTVPLLQRAALESMAPLPVGTSAPILPGGVIAIALGLGLALQGAAALLSARRLSRFPGGEAPLLVSVGLGCGAILPVGWLVLPAGGAGGVSGMAVSAGLIAAVVACGAGAVWVLSPLIRRNPSGWDSLIRLSRQRLHVDGAVFLLINVPVRGLAQLGRFCDWFVLDNLLYGQLSRLPARAGRELRLLQTGQATFYALVALLVTGVLLITLLQVRP